MAVKVDRDIAELKFSNEHSGGFNEGGPSLVEEDIVIFSHWLVVYFVQEDEEAKAKGNDEQRVPDKEEGKRLEDLEEHCDVDVVLLQLGMPAQHHDQLGPGEDDADGGQVPVHLELGAVVDQDDEDQRHENQLHPVFNACEVALGRDAEFETFTKEKEDEKADEDDFEDGVAEDDEADHDPDEDGLHPAGEDDVAQLDTGALL